MLLLLLACAGVGDKETGADDSAPLTCDTTNESCGPGTCDGEGAQMLPGADCLACHSDGGAYDAPTFTLGGTIFTERLGSQGMEGVTIRVTGSEGTTVTLTSNSAGNFYSTEAITPPFSAEAEKDGVVLQMPDPVDNGGCNSCHSCLGWAFGKMYGPS